MRKMQGNSLTCAGEQLQGVDHQLQNLDAFLASISAKIVEKGMDFLGVKDSSKMCHLVAVPLPLRSLINPMMNFCKLLSSREPYSLLITVVLTEEWFGYIGSEPKPDNIKFATIPNVVEFKDTRDPFSFIHAITTEMEAPFEELLDALQPQVSAIVADVELGWPIDLGNRRNIPVAVSNTTSASFFSMMYQYALFTKNRLIPFDFLSKFRYEIV